MAADSERRELLGRSACGALNQSTIGGALEKPSHKSPFASDHPVSATPVWPLGLDALRLKSCGKEESGALAVVDAGFA